MGSLATTAELSATALREEEATTADEWLSEPTVRSGEFYTLEHTPLIKLQSAGGEVYALYGHFRCGIGALPVGRSNLCWVYMPVIAIACEHYEKSRQFSRRMGDRAPLPKD